MVWTLSWNEKKCPKVGLPWGGTRVSNSYGRSKMNTRLWAARTSPYLSEFNAYTSRARRPSSVSPRTAPAHSRAATGHSTQGPYSEHFWGASWPLRTRLWEAGTSPCQSEFSANTSRARRPPSRAFVSAGGRLPPSAPRPPAPARGARVLTRIACARETVIWRLSCGWRAWPGCR